MIIYHSACIKRPCCQGTSFARPAAQRHSSGSRTVPSETGSFHQTPRNRYDVLKKVPGGWVFSIHFLNSQQLNFRSLILVDTKDLFQREGHDLLKKGTIRRGFFYPFLKCTTIGVVATPISGLFFSMWDCGFFFDQTRRHETNYQKRCRVEGAFPSILWMYPTGIFFNPRSVVFFFKVGFHRKVANFPNLQIVANCVGKFPELSRDDANTKPFKSFMCKR